MPAFCFVPMLPRSVFISTDGPIRKHLYTNDLEAPQPSRRSEQAFDGATWRVAPRAPRASGGEGSLRRSPRRGFARRQLHLLGELRERVDLVGQRHGVDEELLEMRFQRRLDLLDP